MRDFAIMTGGRRRLAYKDEFLTPPAIVDALGPFDLDPCAPVDRPWPTAGLHFTIEDDGLSRDWTGRVWLNPPYSHWWTWVDRLAEHGNGLALLYARTDTAAFTRSVWNKATAVLFVRGRVRFYFTNGAQSAKDGGAPSVIVSYGEECASVLETSGLSGQLVRLAEPGGIAHGSQRRLPLAGQARRRTA